MTDQNNYYEANINLQYWIKTNLTGAHCSINYQNMLLNWKKLMVRTTDKRNQQVKKDRYRYILEVYVKNLKELHRIYNELLVLAERTKMECWKN